MDWLEENNQLRDTYQWGWSTSDSELCSEDCWQSPTGSRYVWEELKLSGMVFR